MEYFKQYRSNSYAGSGNQLVFSMREGEIRTGRVFYKISVGGTYRYSLLFSNVIDSTYADGSKCHNNFICDSWQILGARIGRCRHISCEKELSEMRVADDAKNGDADIIVGELEEITFGGEREKNVMPGEFFACDPIEKTFEKDEYLCLEMTFSGSVLPYHEESLLPIFVKTEDGWRYSRCMPVAGMIGCDRPVRERIAYLGDSITQGIGAGYNSYAHWNALLSRRLGENYAFWNLGIGYARASDAASDGAWLYKAKQNDTVFVCFGVNDLLAGRSVQEITADLARIVGLLKKEGKRVILQTVPPFDYSEKTTAVWKSVNEYIKTELSRCVDFVFDNVRYLGDAEYPQKAVFGGHPDKEGCRVWAEALYRALEKIL